MLTRKTYEPVNHVQPQFHQLWWWLLINQMLLFTILPLLRLFCSNWLVHWTWAIISSQLDHVNNVKWNTCNCQQNWTIWVFLTFMRLLMLVYWAIFLFKRDYISIKILLFGSALKHTYRYNDWFIIQHNYTHTQTVNIEIGKLI